MGWTATSLLACLPPDATTPQYGGFVRSGMARFHFFSFPLSTPTMPCAPPVLTHVFAGPPQKNLGGIKIGLWKKIWFSEASIAAKDSALLSHSLQVFWRSMGCFCPLLCPKCLLTVSISAQRNGSMQFHYFLVSLHFYGSSSWWFSLTIPLLASATGLAGNLGDRKTPLPNLPAGWLGRWRWLSSGQTPNESPLKRLMPWVDVVPLNSETCRVSEHCPTSWGAETAEGAQGSRGETTSTRAAASCC